MLLFVDYANFSKYAEIMLLLFISNLVKNTSKQCKKQVNGKHIIQFISRNFKSA